MQHPKSKNNLQQDPKVMLTEAKEKTKYVRPTLEHQGQWKQVMLASIPVVLP